VRAALALVLGTGLMSGAGGSLAFDMGNMMNPSKWMGGDRDRYDERGYDGPGYGGYGMPGGYGSPYGYEGPGGYGMPGRYGSPYGYGGPGGYGEPGGYGAPGGYGIPGGYGGPGMYPGYGGSGPWSGYGGYPDSVPFIPPAARPTTSNPAVYGVPQSGRGDSAEIDALKDRIRSLEGQGTR